MSYLNKVNWLFLRTVTTMKIKYMWLEYIFRLNVL